MKIQHFHFFLKNRPWNHAQDLDHAIPHRSGWSRAHQTQTWPTWWKNKVATFICFKKFSFFLLFSKEQAPKPCPDCRSRDSAQIRPIESSPNQNLTDLVKKQGRDFHQNPQPGVDLPKNTFGLLGVSERNKGNSDFPFFRSVTPRSQNVFFGRYMLG